MDKEKLIKKLTGDIEDIGKSPEGYITVAELKSIEQDGLMKTIDMNTAIVSPLLVSKIKPSHANPYVNSTGVNYHKEFVYSPSFWIYLSQSYGLKKAEPLVISWESANNTIFSIDQGFVGTFKLIPRLVNDTIFWDDLSRPKYEIVRNKLISKYDHLKHTEAYVHIDKEYLENYLSLRKKVAIQVFKVIQDIYLDAEILSLLGGQDHYIEEFKNYEVRISKYVHKENIIRLEVNGYKILVDNSTQDKIDIPGGHYWKGIDGLVTAWRARHEMLFEDEYVYVSDEALEKYECDDDYEIYPLYGSVKYKGQWGISHCNRVGRNGIRLEIKKLYEGVPDEVIDYWNKFSIDISEIEKGENIVIKAERLTRKYFLFGRFLSDVMNRICNLNLLPLDIITLDEERIEYTGWMEFPDYTPISNHINICSFSREQFIFRCKKLYILIGENLQERSLRKMVNILNFPTEDTKGLKAIKLLELILKYLYIAEESGLTPLTQNESFVERVGELKEFNLLSRFFALNMIRQLDAHKSDEVKMKLNTSLETFGIEPNSVTNNYAIACEQVYDQLNDMFININDLLLRFRIENKL